MNSGCTALNRKSTVNDSLKIWLLTNLPAAYGHSLPNCSLWMPSLYNWTSALVSPSNVIFWSHATNLDLFIWALIPCLVFAMPQGVWHCSLYSKSRSTWINFSWILIFYSTWLCMLPLFRDHQCCTLYLAHETFSVDPIWNGPGFSSLVDTVACILGPNIFQLVYPKSILTSSSVFSDFHCLVFGGLNCFTFWSIRL